MVRQFFRGKEQARLLVRLGQIDHGRTTVARVAVHMFKQVQTSRTATVEGLDVARLGIQCVETQQVRDQGLQFGATRQAKRALFFEHWQQQGELLTQLSVRIRQQLRQHA